MPTAEIRVAAVQVLTLQDQLNSQLAMVEDNLELVAQLTEAERHSMDLFRFTSCRMHSLRPVHPATLAAIGQLRVITDERHPDDRDPM